MKYIWATIFLSLVLVFLLPQNIEAMSPCEEIATAESSFENAHLVFYGHVTSTEDIDTKGKAFGLQPYVAKFTVIESYKGFSNQTLTLESEGFYPYEGFKEGHNYLVFAGNYSGILIPNSCSDIIKNPTIIHLAKIRAISTIEPSQPEMIMDGQPVHVIFIALYATYIFGIPIASGFIFYHFFRKILKRLGKEILEQKFRIKTISIFVGLLVFYFMNFSYVHTLSWTLYFILALLFIFGIPICSGIGIFYGIKKIFRKKTNQVSLSKKYTILNVIIATGSAIGVFYFFMWVFTTSDFFWVMMDYLESLR